MEAVKMGMHLTIVVNVHLAQRKLMEYAVSKLNLQLIVTQFLNYASRRPVIIQISDQ